MSRVKEEDEGHPPLVCPLRQGFKINGYRLLSFYCPHGQEVKGKMLEVVRGCLLIKYFLEYFLKILSIYNDLFFFLTIHVCIFISRVTDRTLNESSGHEPLLTLIFV